MSYKIKQCKNCNLDFELKHSANLYCSLECKQIKNSKKITFKLVGTKKMKLCKNCKMDFELINKASLYCSRECKKIKNKEMRKIKYENNKIDRNINKHMICGCCKNAFISSLYLRKYCSKDCSKKYNKIRNADNRKKKKIKQLNVIENLENEEWRKIENFENYEISNFGRIKNIKYCRLLKPSYNTSCYKFIILSNFEKKIKSFLIHRLVCKYFKADEYIEGLEVDHIDENKENNKISNLQWITHKENVIKNCKFRKNKKNDVQ